MDITKFNEAMATAQALARELAADPVQGNSQFAAPIRAAIDNAAGLLAHHQEWLKANVDPVPSPGAQTPAGGSRPTTKETK